MKTFLALSKWRLNRIVTLIEDIYQCFNFSRRTLTLFEEIFQFFTFFEKIFHDQKMVHAKMMKAKMINGGKFYDRHLHVTRKREFF